MPESTALRRLAAGVSAFALGFAGVVLLSSPAAAADLGTVSTEAQLVSAINTANATAGADSFTFSGTGFFLTGNLPAITDELTITGPGSGVFTLYAATFDAFNITSGATSVAMSGFSLENAGLANTTAAIHTQDTALVLDDINVTDSWIGLGGSDGPVTVTNSHFDGNVTSGADLTWTSGAPVSSFDNVTFSDNGDWGFYAQLDGSSSLSVSNSSANDNGQDGFRTSQYSTSTLTFSSTTADSNSDNGYDFDASDDSTMNVATIVATNNDEDGIQLDTYNRVAATVTGVTASYNGDDGMEGDARQHGTLAVTNVVAAHNGDDGLDLEAYLGNVVTANNVTANENAEAGVKFGSHNDGSLITMTSVTATSNTNGAVFDEILNGGDAVLREASLINNTERGILIDQESNDSTGSIISIEKTTSSSNGAGTLNGAGLTIVESHSLVVNVSDSTFSGNSAGQGGGIYGRLGADDPTSLNVTNSTVSGNDAETAGGIYLQSSAGAQVSILNVTVAENTTTGANPAPKNAAVYLQGTDTSIRNSIIAGNTTSDLDVADATPLTINHSLIQLLGADASVATAMSAGPGNIAGVSARLAPLGSNGGTTETHLLLDGSPALDSGDPSTAGVPTTDQRGLARFVGVVDMGAVEMPPMLAATGTDATVPLTGGSIALALGAVILAATRRRRGAIKNNG